MADGSMELNGSRKVCLNAIDKFLNEIQDVDCIFCFTKNIKYLKNKQEIICLYY